jgi:F-type H+-transporting ATPase subunit a
MEHHVSGITQFVNHYLGQFALALLAMLHIQPSDPELPIPEHVVMACIVLVLVTLLALLLRSRLSVVKPGAIQQVAELLLTNPLGFGIKDLLEENIHHGAAKLIPFVGSISVFVLFSNLLGVLPVFTSPTGQVSVPFACAILTFLYLKHFAGPIPWLSPLIFPVEIISTSARIVSLTVRLWANIFASDLLYSIFVGLFTSATLAAWAKSPVIGVIVAVFPMTIPIAFIGLHIFVSIIQAYIFTVLPSVYLGMATADEH